MFYSFFFSSVFSISILSRERGNDNKCLGYLSFRRLAHNKENNDDFPLADFIFYRARKSFGFGDARYVLASRCAWKRLPTKRSSGLYQIKSRYRSWQIRERWQVDDDTQCRLSQRRTCRDSYFFPLFPFAPRTRNFSFAQRCSQGPAEWVNSPRSILIYTCVCVNVRVKMMYVSVVMAWMNKCWSYAMLKIRNWTNGNNFCEFLMPICRVGFYSIICAQFGNLKIILSYPQILFTRLKQ